MKYFGVNVGMGQASNLFGSAISSVLIKPLGQFLYILVMDFVIFIVSLMFLIFMKEPDPEDLMRVSMASN